MQTATPTLGVIYNPRSGSVTEETEKELKAGLAASKVAFEIYTVREGTDAKSLAASCIGKGVRHILASGGDGTVMAVINAILKSGEDVLLSLSPGGTANLIAAALEIPADVEKALKIAFGGEERRVDVGKCGDKFFALGVGIGLAEKLVSGTDDKLKDRLGRMAYALAALKEIRTPRRAFEIVGPEGPITVYGVGIAVVNVGGIGDRIRFAPDARVDDGLLDVCVLKHLGVRDALRLAWRAVLGGLEQDRALDYYQWRALEIGTRGLSLQIDGEAVDELTPISISVAPRAVRVTVPNGN